MNTLIEAMKDMTIEAVETAKYTLMYFFGAWVTKEVIYAESDQEAIFDADMTFNDSRLASWPNGVALFCGNRMVKEYKPNNLL